MRSELTRRVVVTGACGLACAAALTGCSAYGEGNVEPAPAPPAPAPAPGADPSAPPPLASAADIPVGGGVVFAAQEVVVTQPVEGTFAAFTAMCTHQGCLVTEVVDGTINCPCHGSQYAVADGSVVGGPAPSPLAEMPITVADGVITLA